MYKRLQYAKEILLQMISKGKPSGAYQTVDNKLKGSTLDFEKTQQPEMLLNSLAQNLRGQDQLMHQQNTMSARPMTTKGSNGQFELVSLKHLGTMDKQQQPMMSDRHHHQQQEINIGSTLHIKKKQSEDFNQFHGSYRSNNLYSAPQNRFTGGGTTMNSNRKTQNYVMPTSSNQTGGIYQTQSSAQTPRGGHQYNKYSTSSHHAH